MRRGVSLVVGSQVATRVPAIIERDLQVVIAANMALRARYVGMALCQREINGRRGMVDPPGQPARWRVATGTLRDRERSRVRRVRRGIGLVVSGQMALRISTIVELNA